MKKALVPKTPALPLNWPPSRGSTPPWMKSKIEERVPKPKIEFLEKHTPIKTIVLTDEESKVADARQRDWDIALNTQVEIVVALTRKQASETLLGASMPPPRKPVRKRRDGRRLHIGPERPRLVRYLPERTFTVDIDYPLDAIARVTIEPYQIRVRHGGPIPGLKLRRPEWHPRMDVGYVLWQLARVYKQIYRQHKKYGIWGHALSDLHFEAIEIHDNVMRIGIGS